MSQVLLDKLQNFKAESGRVVAFDIARKNVGLASLAFKGQDVPAPSFSTILQTANLIPTDTESVHDRMLSIIKCVQDAVAETTPDLIVIEDVYFSAWTEYCLVLAHGALRWKWISYNQRFLVVSPGKVKCFLGLGRSGKTKECRGRKFSTSHEADASALAHIGLGFVAENKFPFLFEHLNYDKAMWKKVKFNLEEHLI